MSPPRACRTPSANHWELWETINLWEDLQGDRLAGQARTPTGRPRGRPRRIPPPLLDAGAGRPSATRRRPPPQPPVPDPAHSPPARHPEPVEAFDDEHRDTIAVRYFGVGERWIAEVTLGSVTHELGSSTTASKAMNAAMKFYYEQRRAAKRRQGQ